MNLSKKLILKILIICSLLYLLSVFLIAKLLRQNNCQSIECSVSSGEELSSDNDNKITFVLIEFEFFENDLILTLLSICDLAPIHTILVVSQKTIYPPLVYPKKSRLLTECDIRFIETDFTVNKSFIESQIHFHIRSEYVLLIPDSTRIQSNHVLQSVLRHLDQLNSIGRTALILPIDSKTNENNNCIEIALDIKRWTLRYSRSTHSSDSCDAFEGNDYAVLIRRTHLLELNRPFERPFIDSFFIQSQINSIKLKLFDTFPVVKSGRQLFATNERNKWKHELWTKERRRLLYQMIGVKKVIDPNGSVQWFGCTKQTNRCFPTVVNEMPDYLFANRWTPVCCLENLAKTGRHVFQVLESHSVRYWLEGGSLLGAARNGEIIAWDYDIDVGVYREDLQKCPLFADNSPLIDEKGFVWEKASEGDFYRVQYSPTNKLHVDIFPFDAINGTMTKNTWFATHPQDREFPEHFLTPLTRISFIGWNAFAPNNVKQFLEFKFGTNVIQNPEYPNPELLRFKSEDNYY